MALLDLESSPFLVTVEVVPPAGPDAGSLLTTLQGLTPLLFDAFSVASNPVAKPRLSALTLSSLIQRTLGRPAVLHVTTRDHNRLSLQSLLWGARASGIDTVLAATGDYVALGDRARTTTVRDVDVYALVSMARESGLQTGVVLEPRSDSRRLELELRRLERKVEAGAQFAVTQPLYDVQAARSLADATRGIGIPIFLGILPLRSARHAAFLDRNVAGIPVPQQVQDRMAQAGDAVAEGIAGAREMLTTARALFAGACLMPPFDHYEVLFDLLEASGAE
jgi:methylenetetrahydrofolate reductase (NADPH)